MSLNNYTNQTINQYKKENLAKFNVFKKSAQWIEVPKSFKFSLVKTSKEGRKYVSVYNGNYEFIFFTTKFGLDITEYNADAKSLKILLAEKNSKDNICTYICKNKSTSATDFIDLNKIKEIFANE